MDNATPLDAPVEPRADDAQGSSRRWFLVGGGTAVVLLAAGGGVTAGVLHHDRAGRPNPAPAVLVAAAEAERGLLADLDATTGGDDPTRRAISQIRSDHAAHASALTALLSAFDPPSPAASSSTVPGTPRTAAQLRTSEQGAAKASAQRAAGSTGQLAVLLASIAACETTHAALLG